MFDQSSINIQIKYTIYIYTIYEYIYTFIYFGVVSLFSICKNPNGVDKVTQGTRVKPNATVLINKNTAIK